MAKYLVMLIGAIIILLGSGQVYNLAAQENSVTMGPGYVKGQQSEKSLSFVAPHGWVKDEKAAKKLGMHTVLVPSGMKLENADRVITIAFQKKNANIAGLENLKSFFRADLQDTLTQFPDAQFERWQPSKLDPNKFTFMSMEIYGKAKNKPSPQRFVILDAGDGYFSISLTAATRNDLQLPMYEDFFNSVGIGPLPQDQHGSVGEISP